LKGPIHMRTHAAIIAAAKTSPDGYKELGRLKVLDKICWTPPTFSHGRPFCRNEKGDIVCLDMSGGR